MQAKEPWVMQFIRKNISEKIRCFLISSLLQSSQERGEVDLKNRLMAIVPDITGQYTTFRIEADDGYLNAKVRAHHTFQIGITLKAVKRLLEEKARKQITIVDIGDSSGTHLRYLEGLKEDYGIEINAMSVNLDAKAVEKIKAQGLNALQCRAEDLHKIEGGISADIFISFQMLEHLFDPIGFLHSMAEHAICSYFVITVPYIAGSRVGLHHLRANLKTKVYAENTHIFELCPEDWDLVFRFSGWEVVFRDLYTQYPAKRFLYWTKYLWRRNDFEGFYGVILKKNSEISEYYQNW